MFKKNISIVNSRDLSGKDVKTLKRDIKLNFPDLNDEEVSELVPNKAEVSLLKLSNRAQAYSCNGKNPLFFDPEGRGDLLVPSVFVLWKFPHILPSLTTYSEVSPKVRPLLWYTVDQQGSGAARLDCVCRYLEEQTYFYKALLCQREGSAPSLQVSAWCVLSLEPSSVGCCTTEDLEMLPARRWCSKVLNQEHNSENHDI